MSKRPAVGADFRSGICAVVCAVAVVSTIVLTHPNTTRPPYWLFSAVAFLAPALISAGWALWPRRGSSSRSTMSLRRWLFTYAAGAAGLGVLGFILFFRVEFSGFSLVVFVLALFAVPGAVLSVLLGALTPGARATREQVDIHRGLVVALPALGLAGLFLWSFAHATAVIGQAEALSRGAPYCIGVFKWGPRARVDDYYGAAGLYDLTALQMRMDEVSSAGGIGRHLVGAVAMLEVRGPEGPRYWSWRVSSDALRLRPAWRPQYVPPPGAFILGEPPVEVVGCRPHPRYGWSLPLFRF